MYCLSLVLNYTCLWKANMILLPYRLLSMWRRRGRRRRNNNTYKNQSMQFS